jgi:hypothetical protein
MIPSILDYLPTHAAALMQKVAEEPIAAQAPLPQVVPPEHPYWTGAKQLLPIGVGLAAGTAAGIGIPLALQHYSVIPKSISPGTLGLVSGIAGGIGGLASTIMSETRAAELERANKEYQEYHARRAGHPEYPSVQPPEVRT